MPRRIERLLTACLFLGTVLLFLPATGFDFVNYDDPLHVVERPEVRAGLTWEGFRWAFTNTLAFNWHPLTWLSHMLDGQLYGVKPWGHHLTSILLHAAGATVLFVVLRRMTGRVWVSALVAALYGWHPLRVESVAWVAERKDVLCALFWMLTLWAYVAFVKRPGRGRYLLVFALFACGLMSKAMIVTLPCVLLLLDVWPLKRVRIPWIGEGSAGANDDSVPGFPPVGPVRAVMEKLPLLLLAVVVSAATWQAQSEGEALIEAGRLPLGWRLANAPVAYVLYLGKMIWPFDLAVYYPHPGLRPLWQPGGALLVLAGITWLTVIQRQRRPWLLIGWLWYLGSLVPAIGIVQVGEQALADRYSYLPSVGMALMAAFSIPASDRVGKRFRQWAPVAAGGILACFAAVTLWQLQFWRNSETLFLRALEIQEANDLPHNNLGTYYGNQGSLGLAKKHFLRAYELNPHNPNLLANLGRIFELEGDPERAIRFYREALQADPDRFALRRSLGLLLVRTAEFEEAETLLGDTVAVDPGDLEARFFLGVSLAARNEFDEALRQVSQVLAVRPDWPVALNLLATIQAEQGDYQTAVATAERALRLAEARGETGVAADIRRRLEDFKSARPFRP